MTISTADESGKPWVSPVFYVPDEHYNLYWVSSKHAVHSANIRTRPQVAITIFTPGDRVAEVPADGVYLDAEAVELTDEAELATAIEVYSRKKQAPKFTIHSWADITGDKAWRIYKAVPKAVYTREDAVKDGQNVTVRQPVDLGLTA